MSRILIAIPAMDNVDTFFMFDMIRMIQQHPEYDVLPRVGSECFVSRDWLAFYAIQNGYDYICFIDSDETFRPGDIEILLSDDADIVGGVICKREYPFDPILYEYTDGAAPWQMIPDIPNGIRTVDGIGGGAMLLCKVSALRKIHNLTGDLFFPINHWSEDLSFFYRAKQCGVPVIVDGRVKLGHRGKQTVTVEYWKELRG